MNVTVGSLTSTSANGGEGIYASGVSANVVSSGTISTLGKAAYGGIGDAVVARATTGTANVNVNNVTTAGADATGIDARSNSGLGDGRLLRRGKDVRARPPGIYASTGGAGGVSVKAGPSGSVSTTGNRQQGHRCLLGGPVTVSGGTLSTTGKASSNT